MINGPSHDTPSSLHTHVHRPCHVIYNNSRVFTAKRRKETERRGRRNRHPPSNTKYLALVWLQRRHRRWGRNYLCVGTVPTMLEDPGCNPYLIGGGGGSGVFPVVTDWENEVDPTKETGVT